MRWQIRNFVFAFFLLFSFSSAFAEGVSWRLGMIVPLTGPGALMGKSLTGVAKLAETKRLKIVFEDDTCNGKDALSAYRKLRSSGVRVFYMACSGSILAVAPLAKKNGDLILSTYSASTRVRQLGNEVIRLNPDAQAVAGLVPSLLKKDWRPTAVLYEEQEYASSLADYLKALLGSEIALTVGYPADASSLRAELLKIKSSPAKSITFIPVADGTAKVALKEMAELHVGLPVVGEVNLCDYPFSPSDFDLQGACVSAKLSGKEYEEFLRDYEKTVGYPPAYPLYDAMALDLLSFLDKQEILNDKELVASITSRLLSGFEGRFATYEFTPEGESTSTSKYLQVVQFDQ